MRSSVIGFLLFIIASAGLYGQAYFDYHDGIDRAYRQILQLRTVSAQLTLDSLKQIESDNLAILHVENYIDFFTVFLGENENDLQRFKQNKEYRLKIISDNEVDSPFWRFAQAEIALQYALARSKFGQYIRAGWDINRANKLLNKNIQEYPEFLLSNKSLSVIHALIGSIKGLRRSIISLFTSLDGSYEQGVNEINNLNQADRSYKGIFDEEIQVIRALVSYHIEKDTERAFEYISPQVLVDLQSPLIDFVRYTIASNQEIVEYDPLNVLIEAQGREHDQPFDYLNLLIGIDLLHRGDSLASDYILKFINDFDGRHYIKEAHQKMAWYELVINDDVDAYYDWMNLVLSNGNDDIGEDQLAHEEATTGIVPHKGLLRSRLFFDGGHYHQGLNVLNEIDPVALSDSYSLEFYYRKARLLQELKRADESLALYKKVIANGSTDKRYYACNAALQSGVIYYQTNQTSQARSMWNMCLNISPDEHRESLHQKAKSWLQKSKGTSTQD